MNPLNLELKPGVPIYEQLLYAARKAIMSGEYREGDPFPSVRALSADLRINPNTVQKALTALKDMGLLETLPGIGHRVARLPDGSAQERAKLLDSVAEALVLRARELGLSRGEVIDAINNHWETL